MHEVRWDNGGVSIYESSNICTPEIAQTNKFYKHLHSLISTTMKRLLTFDKKPLHMSHNKCLLTHKNNYMLVPSKQRCFTKDLHYLYSGYL